MRWIVVLRNSEGGCHIWQGERLPRLINKLRKFNQTHVTRWNATTDAMIMARYRAEGPGALVGPISKIVKKRVTKNSIIGRHRRLLEQRLKLRAQNPSVELAIGSVVNSDSQLEGDVP